MRDIQSQQLAVQVTEGADLIRESTAKGFGVPVVIRAVILDEMETQAEGVAYFAAAVTQITRHVLRGTAFAAVCPHCSQVHVAVVASDGEPMAAASLDAEEAEALAEQLRGLAAEMRRQRGETGSRH